jgi:hypothetical protein
MQRWKRVRKAALAAITSAAVTACGGGGGSDAFFPTPRDTYNASRVILLLLTGSGRWTTTGVGSDGAVYEITVTFKPDSNAFFPLTGLPAERSTQTITIKRNGVVIATTDETSFFDRQSLAVQGTTRSDGSCSQVTSSSASTVPSSAQAGSGGALDTADDRTTCSTASPVTGTTSRSWSLDNEGLTVFFCNKETNRDAAATFIASEEICLQISSDGSLGNKARVTLIGPGNVSVTARNF